MWVTWLFCIFILWSSLVRQKWTGLDPVHLGNPEPYGSVMFFLELSPWGDYSVSSLSVSSWKYLRGAPVGFLFKEFRVSIVQCLFTLVAPAATPTAARLITPPYLWWLIAMLSTKIKPLSLTFQHPIYHSLVVLISLFPSRDMYHLSRGIKEVCPTFSPLSIACFPWWSCPDTTILSKGYLNQSL